MTGTNMKRMVSSSGNATPPPVCITQTTTMEYKRHCNNNNNNISLKPSSLVFCEEKVQATQLVDQLLVYTESLMKGTKEESSTAQQNQHQHHLIAFSGGIDSSVVTALVHQVGIRPLATNLVKKDQNHSSATASLFSSSSSSSSSSSVTAVLGLSPAVPSHQIQLAEQVASFIGVELKQIPTMEGDDEVYRLNDGRACLVCKTHLYTTCLSSSIIEHYNVEDPHDCLPSTNDHTYKRRSYRLYNGTNADDIQDPTRLGLIAAEHFHVQSPLRYTTKTNVRIVGKHLGLPNWNYAASPCLRSRLALGVTAIPQHLAKIEAAETFVRQTLQLHVSNNMRVRLLKNNQAMIEVDKELLEQVQDCIRKDDERWRRKCLDTLGFQSFDVRPFKTGSVAAKNYNNINYHN